MSPILCPKCHNEVAIDSFSCPLCGQDLSGELEYAEYEGGFAVLGPKKRSIRLARIESEHLGKPVLAVLDDAFADCDKLVSVLIPSSIRYIGKRAFEGCKKISTLLLPESIVEIDDYAFASCAGLSSLSLGNGVATVKQNAICTCRNIAAMRYGNMSMLDMAYSCVCGAFSFSNSLLKVGQYAFYNCPKIKELYIPEGVKSIGLAAFSGCKGLTSASVPMSMEKMDHSFSGCLKLKSIHYNGIKEAWAEIYLGEQSETKAVLSCVNGVTPIVL